MQAKSSVLTIALAWVCLLPCACHGQTDLPDAPGRQPATDVQDEPEPGDVPLADGAPQKPADVVSVTVFASQHEVAAAEVAAEEKQRVFGVIPNFYVAYTAHPTPLSAGQKFHLAWRSTIDPVTFVGTGLVAGIEQANNAFPGYGQGGMGYAKRYGASYADGAISTFLGGAVLPSLLHQDPRYFYQGTGSTGSRARHAVSSVFICRGDDGKREFNYSNVLGNLASAGISNLYYPASDRNGAGLTFGNVAIGTAFGAFAALMQEFVVPKLTPHLPSRGLIPGK